MTEVMDNWPEIERNMMAEYEAWAAEHPEEAADLHARTEVMVHRIIDKLKENNADPDHL